MKRPYIPLGYTKQGRLRPTFLEQPGRHTKTPRTSASDIDTACAIEVYYMPVDRSWLVFDLALVAILAAALAGLALGIL